MNKIKGFTLIELLAVVLILGIIALIAVPAVNYVTESAKENTFKTSALNIYKDIKNNCKFEMMNNELVTSFFTITNGETSFELDTKGEVPNNGRITVGDDCNISARLHDGTYCFNKLGTSEDIDVTKTDLETCIPPYISKSTDIDSSYVGYYTDVNGDGTVDGVIFADLITGKTKVDEPTSTDLMYTIPTIDSDNVKEYYISQKEYDGDLGVMPVLTVEKVLPGEERFYVLALNSISDDSYHWYYSAEYTMYDYRTFTSPDFGKGRENTLKMIDRWNKEEYGEKNAGYYKDLWGEMDNYVEDNWFVPSQGEWAAFKGEINDKLGIVVSNYSDFGFGHGGYWSSSQNNRYDTFIRRATFNSTGFIANMSPDGSENVRLATTF